MISVNAALLVRRGVHIFIYGDETYKVALTLFVVVDQMLVPMMASAGLCVFSIALHSLFTHWKDTLKKKIRRKAYKK